MASWKKNKWVAIIAGLLFIIALIFVVKALTTEDKNKNIKVEETESKILEEATRGE